MAEKQEEYKGAARGTAYHRVMECLDYAETDTEEQLRAQLKRLLESQKMTEQEAECIRIRDIRRFVESGHNPQAAHDTDRSASVPVLSSLYPFYSPQEQSHPLP